MHRRRATDLPTEVLRRIANHTGPRATARLVAAHPVFRDALGGNAVRDATARAARRVRGVFGAGLARAVRLQVARAVHFIRLWCRERLRGAAPNPEDLAYDRVDVAFDVPNPEALAYYRGVDPDDVDNRTLVIGWHRGSGLWDDDGGVEFYLQAGSEDDGTAREVTGVTVRMPPRERPGRAVVFRITAFALVGSDSVGECHAAVVADLSARRLVVADVEPVRERHPRTGATNARVAVAFRRAFRDVVALRPGF